MLFFIKGIILGFSIAAPVGPIGVLCIRRTLAQGMAYGFVSGIGAATADAFYGLLAAFGLSAVAALFIDQQFYLRLIGGFFLCYLGYKTAIAPPASTAATAKSSGLAGAYTSTLLLTLTNPMTILSFAAVFAGLGTGASGENVSSAFLLVFGVFTGSLLWWLCLSTMVSTLRRRFDYRRLTIVNQLSGLIIILFGLASLWSLV